MQARKKPVDIKSAGGAAPKLEKLKLTVVPSKATGAEILGNGPDAVPALVEKFKQIGVLQMILVLVDHDRGVLDPLSTRALTAARGIDSDIQAVVIGAAGAAVAAEVGKFGAKVLHVVNNAEISDYAPMASGRALVGLVDSLKPAAVIAAGSPRGNEQLAHLAAFKDLPMAAECTSITLG